MQVDNRYITGNISTELYRSFMDDLYYEVENYKGLKFTVRPWSNLEDTHEFDNEKDLETYMVKIGLIGED